jgi:hypothetical protein
VTKVTSTLLRPLRLKDPIDRIRLINWIGPSQLERTGIAPIGTPRHAVPLHRGDAVP